MALKMLRKTQPSAAVAVARVLAGAPLVAFGVMHLSGSAPMKPLLEAAEIPLPAVGAVVAPVVQVVAGLMLIGGFYARFGAAMAIGAMIGAIYTHIQIPSDGWPMSNGGPDEPPLMYVAIVVALLSGGVLVAGAGKWSMDRRAALKPKKD